MCLILAAFQIRPQTGLCIAGNRDEYYHRLSSPPEVVWQNPRVIAGKDMEHGGTWMGINQWGVIVALTNRSAASAGTATPDSTLLSRGWITLEALKHFSPQSIAKWLLQLPHQRFRPFHLLFGDSHSLYYYQSSSHAQPKYCLLKLGKPGYYVLGNTRLNDDTMLRTANAQQFLQGIDGLLDTTWMTAIEQYLCGLDADTSFSSPAISPTLPKYENSAFLVGKHYGTVSSSVICSGGEWHGHYQFADKTALTTARNNIKSINTTREWNNPYQQVVL